MDKKKKIVIGVVIAFVVVVGVGVLISALTAPEGIEFDGATYYVGDVIHTESGAEGSDGMIITQINQDDNSFISESSNGEYKMKWDATTGLGKWLVKAGEISPYV